MKKLLLIGAILSIALGSCMKKHNCEEPKVVKCENEGAEKEWDKEDYDKDEDYYDKDSYDKDDELDYEKEDKWHDDDDKEWGWKKHKDCDEVKPKSKL